MFWTGCCSNVVGRPDICGFANSGIRKIVDGMTKAELPRPKIEDADGGVRITIYRPTLSGSEKSSEKSSEKLLALIADNPDITIKQMANALGLSTRAVEKQLSNLQKAQRLAREGADRGGRWRVL